MNKILTVLCLLFIGVMPTMAEEKHSFKTNVTKTETVTTETFRTRLTSGTWFEVEHYGWVFQPSIAVSADWRPYTDGYWEYEDGDWVFVSDNDFGWATYHYGKWVKIQGRGWVWVPGTQYYSTNVEWRVSDNYIGWAPIGDTDPNDYVFVEINFFGDRNMRSHFHDYRRNSEIFSTTTVTKPDYNRFKDRFREHRERENTNTNINTNTNTNVNVDKNIDINKDKNVNVNKDKNINIDKKVDINKDKNINVERNREKVDMEKSHPNIQRGNVIEQNRTKGEIKPNLPDRDMNKKVHEDKKPEKLHGD